MKCELCRGCQKTILNDISLYFSVWIAQIKEIADYLKMSGAVTRLPKPKMRGLLIGDIKRNVAIAFGIATANATAYWYFVARQRKINYENFYKTYDIEKDYARMKAAGVFKNFKWGNNVPNQKDTGFYSKMVLV